MTLLHIIQRPPPEETLLDCIDAALTSAVMGQHVQLVFLEESVNYLLPLQNSPLSVQHRDSLQQLKLYGITEVFVDMETLARQHVTTSQLLIPTTALSKQHLQKLIAQSRCVLSF